MARTTAWRSVALAALAAAAFACKEQVTAPGHCPELCLSDSLIVEDTVLTGIVAADTSLRGYTRNDFSPTLFLSDANGVTSYAIMKFVALPQRWFPTAADTVNLGTIDSVAFEAGLDMRDTTVHNTRLLLYHLNGTRLDSLTTFDSVLGPFTSGPFETVTIPDSVRFGNIRQLINVANITPSSADSFVISLGIAIQGDAATAARLLSADLSGVPPTLRFYVHGAAPRDTFRTVFALTPTFDNFVMNPAPAAPASGRIVIGNQPSSRSFLRFDIPSYFVDSVTVIRATLLLTPNTAVRGIAGESTQVAAQPILKYFHGKSILFQDTAVTGTGVAVVGQTSTIQVEMAKIMRLWRGISPDSLPRAITLRNFSEEFTTVEIDAAGHASGASAPRLQISFVRPFRFGVP